MSSDQFPKLSGAQIARLEKLGAAPIGQVLFDAGFTTGSDDAHGLRYLLNSSDTFVDRRLSAAASWHDFWSGASTSGPALTIPARSARILRSQ